MAASLPCPQWARGPTGLWPGTGSPPQAGPQPSLPWASLPGPACPGGSAHGHLGPSPPGRGAGRSRPSPPAPPRPTTELALQQGPGSHPVVPGLSVGAVVPDQRRTGGCVQPIALSGKLASCRPHCCDCNLALTEPPILTYWQVTIYGCCCFSK